MSARNTLHAGPSRDVSTPKTEFQFGQPVDYPMTTGSAMSLYEQELEKHRVTEARLRKSLIRETALLRQKEALIQQKDILSRESEHRLLNGLQLIASLLSIQSRAAKDTGAAAQLTIAANRVSALARVHRHLHALDHVESVEFRHYLENLCNDLSEIAPNGGAERVVVVEGIELRMPTTTAIPLGFIASELITNSIKYAKSRITVGLRAAIGGGHALSVTDDGPGLPEGFDPAAATQGLGMKLITALVGQIGGHLRIERGDNGKGARVTVLFS